MRKLTETQLIVLSSANRHDADLATRPDHLKPAAAARVAASLVENKLVREIQTKADWPVWRTDAEGKTYSLKILKAGQLAIAEIDAKRAVEARTSNNPVASKGTVATTASEPRTASKIGGIVGLLQNPEGATSEQIIAATGWLPHTLRAALTGLRKRGYAIERCKSEAGMTYHIVPATLLAAA